MIVSRMERQANKWVLKPECPRESWIKQFIWACDEREGRAWVGRESEEDE